MSILPAGNLISKLPFNFRPRIISLRWLKRSGVRCYTDNVDGSELPVRYIPKKCRDVKPTQSSTSGENTPKDGVPASCSLNVCKSKTLYDTKHAGGGGSSTLAKHKQSTARTQRGSTIASLDPEHELNPRISYHNGVMDSDHMEEVEELQIFNGYGQSRRHKMGREISYQNEGVDSEYMKAAWEPAQKLRTFKVDGGGQPGKSNLEISYENGAMDAAYMQPPEQGDEELFFEQHNSKASCTKQGAEKLAIQLLATRAFTALELRKKLNAKHFPVDVVDAVIHDFQDRGLINDGLYAETFSQSRWTSSSWGPRRIKQALMKKGVGEVDVEKAVKVVFDDGEDGGDQRSNMKLSNSSVQKLYVQASKQWQRSQNVHQETRKARIIRWLQYRGFDWSVVSIILKKLETGN